MVSRRRYALVRVILEFCVDVSDKTAYFLTFDEDYNAIVMKSDLPEIQ